MSDSNSSDDVKRRADPSAAGHTDEERTDPESPQEIDPAIAPGAAIAGRYRVRWRLGGGGMGSVWCVHDDRTGEDVALKVLPPQAGTESLDRFRRELTLSRRIVHVNVCRVFDLGEAGGLHFLTMELIEGENLRTRLARGPLPWPDARRLIDELLAGLVAVHEAGIVHRDIKPENILIATNGRAVVVDFGLAWAPTTQLVTAPAIGTPQYMAPEQLAGRVVDQRSDVFATGVVIQEIIDGRSPFKGATSALVSSAILRDSPLPLEGKDLPSALRKPIARVVARALGRDPDSRYASACELRSAWLAALAEGPTSHKKPRPRVVVGGAIIALAVIIATVAITRWVSRDAVPRSGPVVTAVVIESPDDAGATPEPKALSDAAVKPAPLVIVPPWTTGLSHEVLQAYGTYQHQNTHSLTHSNDFHALDFDLALDEPVYPVAAGTVVYGGPATGGWRGYGNIVLLNHVVDGVNYQSLYAHLSTVLRHDGAVSTDTMIGRAGRTGTSPTQVELHLAIYREASFTSTDVNGIGPYGGDAVVPEPFAACSTRRGPCDKFVAGDVLRKTATSPP